MGTTIAVLGTGLLGAGFAENMLNLGHEVRVWNRTASKCAPLVALGATQAETPADAVRGADFVHLVLSADKAVDSVIDALRPALADGVPIIDHSTNLPAGVAERFPRLRADGVRYIHAPVFMGPQHSRTGTGLMMISGPAEEVDGLMPHLSTLTGKVSNCGERPDKAAAIKIIGNSVLIMMTATMHDAFAVGKATGVTPEEVVEFFGTFKPTAAGMGTRALTAGQGPVGFEASMARKDVGLMIESAGADALMLLPAVAGALDAGIASGRGQEDFAAIFRPEGA